MVYQMAKEFATRRYQLTINNPKEHGYDHDTIKAILAKGAKLLYWCMCDEEGKEETYHTHLYLVFYNAVMFKTLKNKFPTAHIEVPQWGTNSENYAYIRKEGTKYHKDANGHYEYADNMNFLHILDFCADEDFTIFAYCLMGNHFHLLAKADADVLQHVMKAVGIRYVAYFNRRYQRDGPLFRGRYNSQPVTTKGYFLRVLRYIHRNPVAAGIVQEMQDYPWSSYLDYFGSRKKVLCQVDTSYALALHGLEWLRSYHQRPELNTRGMLEDSPLPAFTDTELRSFIRMTAGMECHEIPLYPETITTPLLRRLVEQEGAGISQLARLTGLARGDIRRRLL